MNPQPELESDALRSEIDTTRGRMDETMDALGNRLEGRHLVDELLGFFRGRAGDASNVGQRLGRSAESAAHSVVDSVKAHPMPALLAGAGVAWLVYEMRTGKKSDGPRVRGSQTDESGFEDYAAPQAVPGAEESWEGEGGSVAQQAKDKLSDIGGQARAKAGEVRDRGVEKLQAVKERVGDVAGQLQDRGKELYGQTRDRVVTTARNYPLEVGLGCLAVGFLVGLAIPTPEVVHRRLGPTVDRLRERTRAAGAEAVEKGKHVVEAAARAAKDEAGNQGLTGGDAAGNADGNSSGRREEGVAKTNEADSGAAGNQEDPSRGPSSARAAS